MFFATDPIHPYGSFWLDFADKVIKALAVIVGGIWTYRNSFRRKVEPAVSGEVYSKGGKYYVLVTSDLRNLGKSKYTIRQTGTYVGATVFSDSGEEESVFAATVFADHAWIEPEEHIQDSVIRPIPHPSTYVALKLSLRIVSRGTEWNATTILKSEDRNTTVESEGEEHHATSSARPNA